MILDIQQDKLETDVQDWIHLTGYYAHGRNKQDFGLDDATLLHIAAYCGSSNAAQKLLAAGADRTSTTSGGYYMQLPEEIEHGSNAEKVARDKGHIRLADMIRDYAQPRLVRSAIFEWVRPAKAVGG